MALLLQCYLLLFVACRASAQGQPPDPSGGGPPPLSSSGASMATASASASSGALPTNTTSAAVVDATSVPYTLNNSVAVRSTISISNATNAPAFFHLSVPQNESQVPVHIAVSLCTGPLDGIQPTFEANASSSYRRRLLQTAQTRVYVSLDNEYQTPGTGDNPDRDSDAVAYAYGGFAQIALNEDQKRELDDVWIGVWPPQWNWGVTGTFTIEVVATTSFPAVTLQHRYGAALDDTDTNNALLTTFNYTAGSAPNVSLVVLPTTGQYSLPSPYYNSSFCALSDAWRVFANTSAAPGIVASETSRGSTQLREGHNRRTQFEVSNLEMATNYTAWLVEMNSMPTGNISNSSTVALYPAVKLLTKRTPICRLVHDIDFCPQVAYSIPVGRGIPTEQALSVINATVSPNYANFSRTMSTFPCDDPDFGQYSTVRSCVDCKRAYQDWLCAVTMPRCTDPLDDPLSQSAAVLDIDSMNGRQSNLNTDLLPYIVNRNASTSRQKYFGGDLQVSETYGEVLPCLYTCLFVQRNCPGPLLAWSCPQWDITAQSDYGTFADAGHKGLGAAHNGGAGADLARWGGPLRYIAQDNFGKTYCSALGVDLFLRESNGSPLSLRDGAGLKAACASLLGVAIALLLALT
ncbi:unnamed protein product [Parajaminaea phylloscopi]